MSPAWNLTSLTTTIERLEREIKRLEGIWFPGELSKNYHISKVMLVQTLKAIRDQLKTGSVLPFD